MDILAASFVERRGPKMFQCNFTAGPQTLELLGVAASGLSGIIDTYTGQRVWRILGSPMRHPTEYSGLCVQAGCTYPAGRFACSLNLGIVVVDEGDEGIRFVCNFIDSMGWDIASAEMDAGTAMQAIASFLQAHFPKNSGWYLIKGMWTKGQFFGAMIGAPPKPPLP